jgi:hypothetical protein
MCPDDAIDDRRHNVHTPLYWMRFVEKLGQNKQKTLFDRERLLYKHVYVLLRMNVHR